MRGRQRTASFASGSCEHHCWFHLHPFGFGSQTTCQRPNSITTSLRVSSTRCLLTCTHTLWPRPHLSFLFFFLWPSHIHGPEPAHPPLLPEPHPVLLHHVCFSCQRECDSCTPVAIHRLASQNGTCPFDIRFPFNPPGSSTVFTLPCSVQISRRATNRPAHSRPAPIPYCYAFHIIIILYHEHASRKLVDDKFYLVGIETTVSMTSFTSPIKQLTVRLPNTCFNTTTHAVVSCSAWFPRSPSLATHAFSFVFALWSKTEHRAVTIQDTIESSLAPWQVLL